jgi:hypothetical protein
VALQAGKSGVMRDIDVERIEIGLLLEGIRRRWGYDFTH